MEYETTHSVDLPLNKPLRRGGPWCPPASFDTDWSLLMSMFTLAGWMHRVCADLAGCYEIPVWCLVRLRWFVGLRGHVGRPSPMVTTALRGIDFLILTIDDGARPGSRRMSTGLQNLSAEMTGSRHTHSTFHPESRC